MSVQVRKGFLADGMTELLPGYAVTQQLCVDTSGQDY